MIVRSAKIEINISPAKKTVLISNKFAYNLGQLKSLFDQNIQAGPTFEHFEI